MPKISLIVFLFSIFFLSSLSLFSIQRQNVLKQELANKEIELESQKQLLTKRAIEKNRPKKDLLQELTQNTSKNNLEVVLLNQNKDQEITLLFFANYINLVDFLDMLNSDVLIKNISIKSLEEQDFDLETSLIIKG